MTIASLAPHTTSDGSIATHCKISIASTVVTPNIATTRTSYGLLFPWSLTLQMTSIFLCSYEFPALSLTMPPHLKHPSLSPPPPTHGLSTIRGRVENLDQKILNSLRFLTPLIKPGTQRCYTILTPRPHILEQNNQK